jgi:hypothetical protein
MNPTDFLDKTEKGQEEIKSRKYKLHAKTRMLLLLVDGQHSAADLADQAIKIGLSAATLDELYSQGFIGAKAAQAAAPAAADAPSAPGRAPAATAGAQASGGGHYEQYRAARGFMNETIVDALGLKSFFFTLKIEKTSNLDDLRALMDDYAKAMTKSMGEQAAGVFILRMRSLLK